LAQLAERRRVAIVGINHLNKGEGQAMYRAMGSIGFLAAARAAWQVCADRRDPTRSLFLPVKMNLAPRPSGLAFRLSEEGLSWEQGEVRTTADEALRSPDDSRTPARAEAKEWLKELLKDGPVMADDVWGRAKADGMCQKTVKLAKKELGIRTDKTGGPGEPWVWSLPKK
jgi:hypothetical protein